ncbi:MAG: thioesterase family protein, partial [Jatrophihabitans sp.]
PGLQHGGPPSALQVRAAERLAAAVTGRADLFACRIAVDLLRPVPVGDVEVGARLVRAGRGAVVVETSLSAGGSQRLGGRVWLLARHDTAAVADGSVPRQVPDAAPHFSFSFPFSDSVDWHEVEGAITVPGPAVVWARPRIALVAGEDYSSLQRATLIADSGNGISATLDWDDWTFLNVDLDVHLARPIVGDWLHMAAETHLGTQGTALARSTLADTQGPVGAGAQTLLIARRHTAD